MTCAMVPPEAARRIPRLLISTVENGSVSTHQTFLAAAQSLVGILSWKKSNVLLSCCLKDMVLNLTTKYYHSFLSKQIQLFVTPPDTTGVTQLLDQLNKNVHQEYEKEKASFFANFNTPNREAHQTGEPSC